jgi:L-threonylcarbamoyladenylate synthase
LDGRIDMILDGGQTRVGVESTVLDLTTDPPQILRPGGVSFEELRRVLDIVELHPVALAFEGSHLAEARSPGMRHRHYAPRAKLIVVEGELNASIRKIRELTDYYKGVGMRVGVLSTDESMHSYSADSVKSLGSREDLTKVARNLFKMLREFDEEDVDVIIAEGVPEKGLGLAVMNRLRKASGYNIIRVD